MFDATAVTNYAVTNYLDTISAGLDAWATVDLAGLSADDLRRELKAIEALRARLDALSAARLARVSGDPRAWVRHQLGLSGGEARARARTAQALQTLPGAAAALAAGAISAAHVNIIAIEAQGLDADRQAALVDAAKTLPPDEIAKRARFAVWMAAGDDGAAHAHQQSEQRTATRSRNPDGMCVFHAELDTESDQILFNALDLVMDQQWRIAHPQRAPALVDRPPYRQRMADALVEMARRTLTGQGSNADGVTTPRPSIHILLDYQTLLHGVHDHSVCETDDGQPIPPAVVRRLACDAHLIPIVLGGPGEILDVGRAHRFPTPAQRAAVYARDRHCTQPGCDTPARWCEIHHKTSWEHRGPTNLDNLELKCPRHHHLIHQHRPAQPRAGPSR